MEDTFIKVHRALNNAVFIINTKYIIACGNSAGNTIGGSKNQTEIWIESPNKVLNGITVNESAEKIYAMLNNLKKPNNENI